MERLIFVDLGTNTAIFSVAEQRPAGLFIVYENSITTRIGENIALEHSIPTTALKRNIDLLGKELNLLKQKYSVNKIYAFTTEGVRSANNAKEVILALNSALGIEFDIVSGEDEARFTVLSVKEIIKNKTGVTAVCDIGGGSTEVNILKNNKLTFTQSLKLGVVRLKNQTDMSLAKKALLPLKQDVDTLVLCGGTGTVTAAIMLGLEKYDPNLIEGFEIKRQELQALMNKLSKLKVSQIRDLLHADKDRADVIVSGVVIMDALFEAFNPKTFLITTYGPRHGYISEKLKLTQPIKISV